MHTSKILTAALLSTIIGYSCSKDQVNSIDRPAATQQDTIYPNQISYVNGADSSDNSNMLLGNPTSAMRMPSYTTNYFIDMTYYATSYNSERGIPNWVSWHLYSGDVTGAVDRSDVFQPYTLLPTGWYQVQIGSYDGGNTGFDRGHDCPSGDRTATLAANLSTFYMINMIPQAKNLNQGPWGRIESVLRDTLVKNGKEAFIVMGNYGKGGYGLTNGNVTYYETLDNGRVSVPAHVFKIAVILANGNKDLSRIDSSTQILAVDMPNNQSLYTINAAGQSAWRSYSTTIKAIEDSAAKYGQTFNFLSNVGEKYRTYLKSKTY